MPNRTCSVGGCDRRSESRGWCDTHYRRWHRNGDPGEAAPRRALSGTKGGLSSAGYPWVFDKATRQMVYVHRLVMSETIGRPLRKGEEVHHINGIKTDNRAENLELWSTSQPAGQRVADKIAWAREILALYEPLDDAGLI